MTTYEEPERQGMCLYLLENGSSLLLGLRCKEHVVYAAGEAPTLRVSDIP